MRPQIGPTKKAAGAENAVGLAEEGTKVLVQVAALNVEDDVEGGVGEGRPIGKALEDETVAAVPDHLVDADEPRQLRMRSKRTSSVFAIPLQSDKTRLWRFPALPTADGVALASKGTLVELFSFSG